MASSLAEFLRMHFEKHGKECAYRQRHGYRYQSFSYDEILVMARRFAGLLDSKGVSKGDRVMFWGENSAEWVAAFFGCTLRGVIVVPMEDGADKDFAKRVHRQVDAKLLVASRRHIEGWGPESESNSVLFEETRRSQVADKSTTQAVVGPGDVLQIVFTSGTTADPKGVVITHGNALANIAPLEREMQRYLKYERLVHPVRFLNLLPLSHVFGQFLGMFLPPILGGTVIFQNELGPSEVITTIRREKVSVLVSVPRVLQSLKQKIERDLEASAAVDSFRRRFTAAKGKHFLLRWWMFRDVHRTLGWKFWAFISGGAALDSETEEFWGRLGYAAIQGYGLTETTSLISVNHPFRLGKGSIGKVLPGREVKLGNDGEILVKGGGVATGYWDAAGEHSVSDTDGWYRTGDVGALDESGNLYFKGRKKDVIVTAGGTNIYPGDLEAALKLQPEVRDCVVIGIERGGNAEPCAVVIARESTNISEVVQRANDSLAKYQRIRTWIEWPEEDFPRTSTQKPKRNVISETVRVQLAQSEAKPGSRTEGPLSDLISKVAGRSVPAFNSTSRLDSELGLSSLDRVELMSALEDRYQVDLTETRFNTIQTVGDLEKMLRGEVNASPAYHYPRWVLHWPVTWLRLLAHYLLMRPAIMLLGWPRIVGREHLQRMNGPFLVVANHLGDVDPGFILTALPARLRHRLAIATGGEALEILRVPPSDRLWLFKIYDRLRWILGVSLLNLFPLPRQAGFRRSFAYAGEAVDRGYSVLVFPEGRHTTDGNLGPFRSGIGLLAQNLMIPVLPIRIDGLFEVKQAGRIFAGPWKITVRIGKPLTFVPDVSAEEIAVQLRSAVETL